MRAFARRWYLAPLWLPLLAVWAVLTLARWPVNLLSWAVSCALEQVLSGGGWRYVWAWPGWVKFFGALP